MGSLSHEDLVTLYGLLKKLTDEQVSETVEIAYESGIRPGNVKRLKSEQSLLKKLADGLEKEEFVDKLQQGTPPKFLNSEEVVLFRGIFQSPAKGHTRREVLALLPAALGAFTYALVSNTAWGTPKPCLPGYDPRFNTSCCPLTDPTNIYINSTSNMAQCDWIPTNRNPITTSANATTTPMPANTTTIRSR